MADFPTFAPNPAAKSASPIHPESAGTKESPKINTTITQTLENPSLADLIKESPEKLTYSSPNPIHQQSGRILVRKNNISKARLFTALAVGAVVGLVIGLIIGVLI